MSRNIIAIGASELGINIVNHQPAGLLPDGRMLHASIFMARAGHSVSFVSEAARDKVGDLIVSNLDAQGVDTRSIDRFTGGHTPLNLRFLEPASSTASDFVRYREYPDENFDTVWPRVGRDDIVLMGDHFAVAPRSMRFIREFTASARQRKAIIVYAPGFDINPGKPLTVVKPLILDNLENSDFVIATRKEVETLFGAPSLDAAYRDNIAFYCRNFIGIDDSLSSPEVVFYRKDGTAKRVLPDESMACTAIGQAAVIAAIVGSIAETGLSFSDMAVGLTGSMTEQVMDNARFGQISL